MKAPLAPWLKCLVVAVTAGALLTSNCGPRSFADIARAKADVALGPISEGTARRELHTYVEGAAAMVTVIEVLLPNVVEIHGSVFPQVWVPRSGAARAFDAGWIGEGRTVTQRVSPEDAQDEAGARKVAASLLPPEARIYAALRSPGEWRPMWFVYALTSDINVGPPTGLIVRIVDSLAILDAKFPSDDLGRSPP